MSLIPPPTPAIVAQAAVRPLPRWALWVLCLAYILPGYLGRTPWKNTDVVSYAVIQQVAAGNTDWWWPDLAGKTVADFAPLLHGLGGVFVSLLPSAWDWAYQLPTLLALGATLYVTWHAAFRLALLPGAQPLTLAFGGHALPLDYARALADSTTLALLACLGLAQFSHESGPVVFWALGMAMQMRAAAHLLTPDDGKGRWRWLAWHVAGSLVLLLSHQGALALASSTMGWAWLGWSRCPQPANTEARQKPWLWVAVTMALVWGSWLLLPVPSRWSLDRLAELDIQVFLQLVAWFTWPAWPMALWTLWKWHAHWRMAHLLVPLSLTALGLYASVSEGGSDRALIATLPPLALLAALALPTLRRSAGALIDWFSLLFFSLCALVIWVVWVAMQTGIPATPARNVARLAPGFAPSFEPVAFAVAAIATLAWLWVVLWRTSHHPTGLWKSLVIPASGSTLGWLLLMTLWLPLLNHARGYQGLVGRIAAQVPRGTCVIAWRLQDAPIAALLQQGKLDMRRGSPTDTPCNYLVAPSSREFVPSDEDARWTPKVRASRLTDQKETLVLWHRPSTGVAVPVVSGGPPGRAETAD